MRVYFITDLGEAIGTKGKKFPRKEKKRRKKLGLEYKPAFRGFLLSYLIL